MTFCIKQTNLDFVAMQLNANASLVPSCPSFTVSEKIWDGWVRGYANAVMQCNEIAYTRSSVSRKTLYRNDRNLAAILNRML